MAGVPAVEFGQQRVLHAERARLLGNRRFDAGEDEVLAVLASEQQAIERQAQLDLVDHDVQVRAQVVLDVGLARLDLVALDLAIAVGIELQGGTEIGELDHPFAAQAALVHLQRQVGLVGHVRARQAREKDSQSAESPKQRFHEILFNFVSIGDSQLR